MRLVIRDLVEVLHVDEATAERVEDLMVLDFSECTQSEFVAEARAALEELA